MLSNALTYAKASVMCASKERINKKKHTHTGREWGARWGERQMKDRESLFNKAAILRE